MQLAFQRFQLQQDRVDRLSKQLQDYHNQTEARKAGFKRLIGQLEVRISQEQDPTRRKALELEMKALTSEREQQDLLEQQEQAKEIQFSGQLQTEQAKLNELSDQLNELEKKLQQDQPTPAPSAK